MRLRVELDFVHRLARVLLRRIDALVYDEVRSREAARAKLLAELIVLGNIAVTCELLLQDGLLKLWNVRGLGVLVWRDRPHRDLRAAVGGFIILGGLAYERWLSFHFALEARKAPHR